MLREEGTGPTPLSWEHACVIPPDLKQEALLTSPLRSTLYGVVRFSSGIWGVLLILSRGICGSGGKWIPLGLLLQQGRAGTGNAYL